MTEEKLHQNAKESYIKFIQANILLTPGEEVYEIEKDKFNLDKLKLIEFDERDPDKDYYYEKHIMIMIYIESKNPVVSNAVLNFAKEYNKNTKVKPEDIDKKLYERMHYFMIGNRKWTVDMLNNYSKVGEYDKIESESIRLLLRNLLLTMNRESFKIYPGIPISVIKNGKISNSVQIYSGFEDDIVLASSQKNKYKFPPLIINAMYYKIKINNMYAKLLGEAVKKINPYKKDKFEEKLIAFDSYINNDEDIKKTLGKIKKEIDLASLANNRQNIYMMIQLLSKMFTLSQLNSVIKEIDK